MENTNNMEIIYYLQVQYVPYILLKNLHNLFFSLGRGPEIGILQ